MRVVRLLFKAAGAIVITCFTTVVAVFARDDEVGLVAGVVFGLAFSALFAFVNIIGLKHNESFFDDRRHWK